MALRLERKKKLRAYGRPQEGRKTSDVQGKGKHGGDDD
jgi:hypothetical protein